MRMLRWFLVALAGVVPPCAALAQGFPDHAIKLILPFPAGGPTDIVARVVAQRMGEILGQAVVVDNRGGAGGVVGTDAVAKAKPDGYTIGVATAGAISI